MEYRRLLFTTPGLEQHVSGVILFEETLFDKDPTTGQSLVKPLQDKNILLGIKVRVHTRTRTHLLCLPHPDRVPRHARICVLPPATQAVSDGVTSTC